MNIWRRTPPQTRYYSFYSCPHNLHTRIDLFLLSAQLLHRVIQSKYLSRNLSDHSPLTLSILFSHVPKYPYRWRLNPTLLQRDDFCTFMRDKIKLFGKTNSTSPKSFIFLGYIKGLFKRTNYFLHKRFEKEIYRIC